MNMLITFTTVEAQSGKGRSPKGVLQKVNLCYSLYGNERISNLFFFFQTIQSFQDAETFLDCFETIKLFKSVFYQRRILV